MLPRSLQVHLDWHAFLFRVNQASDRWNLITRVLRHILMADSTYHGWDIWNLIRCLNCWKSIQRSYA